MCVHYRREHADINTSDHGFPVEEKKHLQYNKKHCIHSASSMMQGLQEEQVNTYRLKIDFFPPDLN